MEYAKALLMTLLILLLKKTSKLKEKVLEDKNKISDDMICWGR